jgi:hypothetical protein
MTEQYNDWPEILHVFSICLGKMKSHIICPSQTYHHTQSTHIKWIIDR